MEYGARSAEGEEGEGERQPGELGEKGMAEGEETGLPIGVEKVEAVEGTTNEPPPALPCVGLAPNDGAATLGEEGDGK